MQIKDPLLRLSVRRAEQTLAVAERDARKAERALNMLKRREQQAREKGSRRTVPESLVRARWRAVGALKEAEKSVRDRRKILARLKRQVAQADKSLREMGSGSSTLRHTAPTVFGSQLRAARAMLALSRTEMAARLDISAVRLGHLERETLILDEPPSLRADIARKLSRLGIELVSPGVYVGDGGAGIRLKRRRASGAKSAARKNKPTTVRTRRGAAA